MTNDLHTHPRPRRSLLASLLAVLCILATSGLGSAALAEDFDALVAEGAESYEAGDFVAAIELFEAAYAIEARSNLLYNMGIAAEKQGNIPGAIDYYTRFITAPGVDHEVRKDAIERIKTLQEVLALTGGGSGTVATGGNTGAAQQNGINVNTATQAQLETLNGIGPTKARAIIDDRVANGPFASIDDMTRVHGIGAGTVKKIRDNAFAGPVDPSVPLPTASSEPAGAREGSDAPAAAGGASVDFNTADASLLQTIPGIGPSKAQAIIEERTTNGPFASCDDLTRVKGIGAATARKLRPHCTVSTAP